jgi:hypothetical protein
VLLPSTTSGYVFEVLADGQRIGEIPFDIVIQGGTVGEALTAR